MKTKYPRLTYSKLKDLKSHPDGCRTHAAEAGYLLPKSIGTFNLLRPPFVVNVVTGHLIDGDQMRTALLAATGWGPEADVPVWEVEVPEHLEDAAHLALQNHTGEWVWQPVSEHLKALKEAGVDPKLTGFLDSDIGPLTAADWKPKEKGPLDGSDPAQGTFL